MISQRSLLACAIAASAAAALASGCSGGGGGGGSSGGFASLASTSSLSRTAAVGSHASVGAVSSRGMPAPAGGTPGSGSTASGGFFLVAPLQLGRVFHTATTLLSGKVLVAGGQCGPAQVTATTEVFDPSTGTLAAGPALATARMNHAAVLLPSGELLVIGGQSDVACQETLASTEVLAPNATAFTAGPTLSSSRSNPAVALYQDSTGAWKVVVAGGTSMDGGTMASVATVEVIDAATKTVTPAPTTLVEDVAGAQAVSLGSGQILIQGGYTQVSGGSPVVAASEILDLNTGIVTQLGLTQDRAEGALVSVAPGGPVLAIGGTDGQMPLASIEGFQSQVWSPASTSLASARLGLVAQVVQAGGSAAVLVMGGLDGTGAIGSSELVGGAPGLVAPALAEARGYAASAVLPNGDVVLVGGTDGTDILASVEVFSASGQPAPGAGGNQGPLVALHGPNGVSSSTVWNGATFWNGATLGNPGNTVPVPMVNATGASTGTGTSTSTSTIGAVTSFGLPADPNDSAHLQFALGVVNAARANAGLPALALDPALCTLALKHATDDQGVHWADGSGGFCHDWNNGDVGTSTAENAAAAPLRRHHRHHGFGGGIPGGVAFPGGAPGGPPVQLPGFPGAGLAPTPPADPAEIDFLRATRRMLSPLTLVIETQLVSQTPGASPNFTGGTSEQANLLSATATAVGFGFSVDQANRRLIIVEDFR